ncbi:Bromodomain and PHD finger-containing protein 3 [Camellia lanceoleosa]|uniref:Bromodomain and PHD finger-containing protein 3 n=1 Tax=Camellia lanceoleosa TaxID=1840588 RepID=A0ACC0HLU2_9ERIC|nr:Bromodomain and PHD finger-containing protein 3 [Camellia lanceoleosa]
MSHHYVIQLFPESDQPLVIKPEGSAKLDDNATSTGQPSVMSPIPFMPVRRILELVLDILQRQDTYELFAEPVDPKEVEDYYEIIKEPMDFGTLRAKLHGGMYTNLEQFEACAIYDLAKKVFHALKTDFENFELEFSETRQRSSRGPQGEANGARDGRRSNFVEVDRRCTYKPWLSFHKENDSIFSTIHSAPQLLSLVNQCDISYRESLMLFAKGLGPTAQMIANRKLQGCLQDAPNFQTPASDSIRQVATCQVPAAFASAHNGPSTLDTLIPNTSWDLFDPLPGYCSTLKTTTTDVIDLTDADDGEKADTSDRMGDRSALGGKVVTNREGDGKKSFSISDRDKVLEKQISDTHLGLSSSTCGAEVLNSCKSVAATVDSSKTDSQVQCSHRI